MQHIHDILSALLHNTRTPVYQHTSQTHIPDHAWLPDGVDVLASMDAWTHEMSRRGSQSRESVTGRVYDTMRCLRTMYGGLQYTELLHISQQAHATKGFWAHNMIALLERRLDVVIWRALWARSPQQARRMIASGHITVNGMVRTQSSYSLQPGDVVAVRHGVRHMYQQRLVDFWSHMPEITGHDTVMDTSTSPVSPLVDIMQRAVAHGTIIDTLPQKEGALGYACYAPRARRTRGMPGLSTMATDVLSRVTDDTHFAQSLWPYIVRGMTLDTSHASAVPMRMPHLEVDYATVSLVYLYTPQRVLWTSLLDVELLQNHLN
jgi:ribosomal protein S4